MQLSVKMGIQPAAGLTRPEIETARKLGIGGLTKQLMLQDRSNDFVLAAVKMVFPEGQTSSKTVQWYRNEFRELGCPIFTARELKRLEKKARR